MSIYVEQIKQLVALQHVDDDIFKIQNELNEAPKELEILQAKFLEIDARYKRSQERFAHLLEQEKRINLEIDEDLNRIKKSKNKLMQVANSREYQAMAREMDNMEKSNRSREDERKALQDEKIHQQTTLAEVEASWAKDKELFESKRTTLDERIAVAQAKLAELEEVRKVSSCNVSAPVFSRYEFIRKRLAHPVIVPVTSGVCAGCCIAIPPQVFIELQGGQKIINCPNCQRLIFWIEHFKELKPEVAVDEQADELE